MSEIMKKGDRFVFSDAVKARWRVRRDDCGDEYVRLNGKKALGSSGLDHIYIIGPARIGLWLTISTMTRTIKQLQSQIPDLKLEQRGVAEAVLSAPVEQLDELCRAVNARARRIGRPATDEECQRLAAIRSRSKKSLGKQRVSA